MAHIPKLQLENVRGYRESALAAAEQVAADGGDATACADASVRALAFAKAAIDAAEDIGLNEGRDWPILDVEQLEQLLAERFSKTLQNEDLVFRIVLDKNAYNLARVLSARSTFGFDANHYVYFVAPDLV